MCDLVSGQVAILARWHKVQLASLDHSELGCIALTEPTLRGGFHFAGAVLLGVRSRGTHSCIIFLMNVKTVLIWLIVELRGRLQHLQLLIVETVSLIPILSRHRVIDLA